MYIINVIPLMKIPRPHPQILSYFFNQKLPPRCLVQVSIRNKKINALVLSSENLENKKIELRKKFSFELKSIQKVITENPVITKPQLQLLFWFSEYYFVSLGATARLFVSRKLVTAKRFRKNYKIPVSNKKKLVLTPENKKEVFAGYKHLNTIIIRQADNFRYQSWGRKPYYNAQQVAFKLAEIFKASIDLKTDNPKIKTYYQSQNKQKYNLIIKRIKHKKNNSKLVDLRNEIKNKNYSIISKDLQTQLLASKKSILYIPRRGASTFILCRDCGHVLKCPHCDVPLVYHQGPKLLCHHCGTEQKPPSLCPQCRGHRIKYFGAGTQKVETELKNILFASPLKKKIKILRLDSDIAEKPEQQQKIINKFNKFPNAILIGTQMLIDKGINPADLVAIISIETLLNLPDYRSSEQVFRIITQLHTMSKKYFYVQTYNPDNFVFKTALDNNWEKFYNKEIEIRKSLKYPPFSQIIKLSFKHKNPKKANQEARILFTKLNQQIKSQLRSKRSKIDLLGPVPAFIPKIAGKYQWHIVIKSQIKNLKTRNKLLKIIPPYWEIEVDSSSLL